MAIDPIIRTAQKEEAKLLAELEKNPIYQRLQAVRRVIEIYGTAIIPEPAAAVKPAQLAAIADSPLPKVHTVEVFTTGKSNLTAHTEVVRGPPPTKTARIVSATARHFRTTGKRAQSLELVQMLAANGVDVGGKKATALLAAYLARSSLFDNASDERGRGFGLREWSAPTVSRSADAETPDSGKLSGASNTNGMLPLNT